MQDELWDIYDQNRHKIGRVHRRADPLLKGDYHLVVMACLLNSKGEFLITKRAPTKSYANLWEFPGGCAVAGDDGFTAAIREVKEETGLDVDTDIYKLVISLKLEKAFLEVWVFLQDFDINDVILLPGETVDAKYATMNEIREMMDEGKFFPDEFLEELFVAAKEMLMYNLS